MSLAVEKRTIVAMIRIYCNELHCTAESLCGECTELQNYALNRINHCPFKTAKPACNTCTIHCYTPGKREKIREVMRYSWKKMFLKYPYLSIMHFIKTLKKKENKVEPFMHNISRSKS